MSPIRNAVISRLFGAYTHKKFNQSYHITQKAVRHEKTGGFFAWIAGREAKKVTNFSPKICAIFTKSKKKVTNGRRKTEHRPGRKPPAAVT